MSADWVAGVIRARALLNRRLGPGRTRLLAASTSLEDALHTLTDTSYGRNVVTGQTLEQAQRGVAEVLLWHVRVLAGWLPREGVRVLRAAAGWYEIANIDDLLAGRSGVRPYALGSLDTAWSRLARASSTAELRQMLAESPWGDPGGDGLRSIRLALRLDLAERIAVAAPQARPWAAGAMAVLVLGERFGSGTAVAVRGSGQRLIGTAVLEASDFTEAVKGLPSDARWPLEGVHDVADLWRAQARCWARVEGDGMQMLRGSTFDVTPVLGVVGVLAVDAWRVRAALEMAAHGGGRLEVYDAVA